MNSKKLNLQDSICIVVGSMIGSGIFIVSADISRQVQSGLLLMLVWIIASIVTICGSLSFAELASNILGDGGQYVYLKKTFNNVIAFLFGWTTFLVIQTGTIAAVCTAFSKFIGILIPYISASNIAFTFFQFEVSTQKLFTLFIVFLLTYINSRGLKYGVITQNIFTITKILSLIAIICVGILFGLNWDILYHNLTLPINYNCNVINVISTATVGAMFASITWNHITFISKDVEKPSENIPKALLIGSFLVIVLYFLINTIYIGSLPLNLIQNAPEDIVAVQLMTSIFGSIGKTAIAVVIMISAFGCANGMILSGSRLYYTMAKDKLFFKKLAIIDRKTNTPKYSLWLQCLWLFILVLWGNYTQLLDYVIYTTLIFYWLTVIGIFINRKKQGTKNLTYKAPAIIPLIFLIITGYIIICLTIFKPTYTLPGLFITILGLPIYYIWKNKSNN